MHLRFDKSRHRAIKSRLIATLSTRTTTSRCINSYSMPRLVHLLLFLITCFTLYIAWELALKNLSSPLIQDGIGTTKRRPNIVLILTDDQDLHMNSMDYMPLTRELIADQGTEFTHHFCTNALCCPSRVTLWTGKSPHNHNVTDVNPPHGNLASSCSL
jgi:hypothetical protein